jgi:hypothetical protein
MPKNNARKNVHTKKRAKLRLKIWDLKASLQAPPKATPKPKRAAAAAPAK